VAAEIAGMTEAKIGDARTHRKIVEEETAVVVMKTVGLTIDVMAIVLIMKMWSTQTKIETAKIVMIIAARTSL